MEGLKHFLKDKQKKPPIFLVCGVPGSGKSWVCKRLEDKFNYVKHDDYMKGSNLVKAARIAAIESDKPIIMDCPFAERLLKEDLEKAGFEVKPYFIVESVHTVADRYRKRTGNDLHKSALTRAATIENRAKEWKAPYGTSEDVLGMLNLEAKLWDKDLDGEEA